MRQIPLGAKGSFSLLVQPEHLANRFKDAILPPVFATPVMIMVMENAALNAIRAYLDPGESAVGQPARAWIAMEPATPRSAPITPPAEVCSELSTRNWAAMAGGGQEACAAPTRSRFEPLPAWARRGVAGRGGLTVAARRALRGRRTAASIRPNERRWCAVSSSCHATTEAVQ